MKKPMFRWSPVPNKLPGSLTGFTTISAKTHAVTLSGLSSKTTYSYRMIAKDLAGNEVLSEVLTFSTKESSDEPDKPKDKPPVPIKFLRITLSNLSNTSVTINWTTDKATTGLVEYGPGFSLSLTGSKRPRQPTT